MASVAVEETLDDSSNNTHSHSLADWMGKLPDRILKKTLHKLVIPGSHNSGCYEMRKELGIGPDADQSVRNLASLPLIGSMSRDIIQRYAKCQNLSIFKQLEAGIRFLDMRVAYHQQSEELHIVHSMFGPKISECMEDVKKFMDEHKTEVVLLKFNHFYSMELEHHLQLITYLMFIFDSMLCPYSSLADLNLRSLRDNNTRVVIFYQDSSVLGFPEFWPKPAIHTLWPNTMDADKVLAGFEQWVSEQNRDRFLVCQAVLTPDTNTIIQNLSGSLLDVCAMPVNQKFLEWVSKTSRRQYGSVVYTVDFIEQCDFVKSVITLCRKCGE